MKIIVMNELVEKGGAEMQTRRERDLLRRHGHNVMYITFDSKYPEGQLEDDEYHFNFPFEVHSSIGKVYYRWVVNKKLKENLSAYIQQFSPDCIHINNIIAVRAVTVYGVLKNYFSVQTIRDAGAVCPTAFCVCDNGEVCKGFCSLKECLEKCKGEKQSFIKGVVQKVTFMKHKAARITAIDKFITPSEWLAQYCKAQGMDTVCINNPFDFDLLHNNKIDLNNKHRNKKYLFYGGIAEYKGIFELVSAFEKFAQEQNAKLYIVGEVDQTINDRFKNAILESNNIEYLGKFSYAEVMEFLPEIYTVVVPSWWMENYPNTVLESITNKCLVIGSNRGGIPELIGDDSFIFDIGNEEDLINKLRMTYILNFEKYQQVVEMNYQRIYQKNSLESYYCELMKVLDKSRHE